MMFFLILAVATYGLITADNLIRKIMCLVTIEGIIILTFLTTGFTAAGTAPILTGEDLLLVDPIPQALMLTAIVIGVCFNSLVLVFIVRLYEDTGTIEVSKLYER